MIGNGAITKVAFGWTSIIGYLLTIAAAIPLVVETINKGLIAFQTGGIYALAVVVLGGITTLIRGLQATAKAKAIPPSTPANLNR